MVAQQLYMRYQKVAEQKHPDDMTVDELKEYYDKGGANRLQNMDEGDQQDMFRKYTVSRKAKQIFNDILTGLIHVYRKTKRN